MKILRDENGQVLVMTVLCMACLLGFVAFATDVGLLIAHKRLLQSAADAAAVAASDELTYASTDGITVKQAATNAAAQNGVKVQTGTTVTVNNGPLNGPYKGNASYVEVIIQQSEPTILMSLFHVASVPVTARAVAGQTSNSGCIWTLDGSGNDISNTGSGTLSIPSCDIYDDSADTSDALTNTGSGSITAKAIGIVGGYKNTGSGSISPNPVTGMTTVGDPLSFLQPPTIPTSTGTGCVSQPGGNTIGPGCYKGISNTGSGTLTLSPGNYVINGDITNTGSGTLILGAGNYIINGNLKSTGSATLTLGNGSYTISGNFTDTGSGPLTLGSGLYIVEGDLGLTGSGAMTGSSVSFYTEGNTSVTGSGTVNISAPTSGPENGILFFQSRTDTQGMSITGSSNLTLQGIIYAPAAVLSFTGSGSGNTYADIVVSQLNLTGSTTFQNYSVLSSTSPLAGKNSLVE
jgi:Flp pilus assembly protein TadG